MSRRQSISDSHWIFQMSLSLEKKKWSLCRLIWKNTLKIILYTVINVYANVYLFKKNSFLQKAQRFDIITNEKLRREMWKKFSQKKLIYEKMYCNYACSNTQCMYISIIVMTTLYTMYILFTVYSIILTLLVQKM